MQKQDNADKANKESMIEPTKYTADSTFNFRCHKGVQCFTLCCRNINIILPPYDIIRIKNRLGITSAEFLTQYTRLEFLGQTQLPVVVLEMPKERQGKCPFLTEEGCSVYEDRPSACRYYPVGMATFKKQEGQAEDEDNFYFMVRENHCLGFHEDKAWTIAEWRTDQGVDKYDEMNKGWMEFILRKKSYGPTAELSKQALQMFFMVTSDIDKFRKFVFESSFFRKYNVSDDKKELIRNDEIALMTFGFDWLKSALFGADAVQLKDEVLQDSVNEVLRKADEARAAARVKSE